MRDSTARGPLSILALSVLVLGAVLVLACPSSEQRFAAHVEAAHSLARAGELDDAILAYRSALEIDSSDADVNERLAELLLERGSEDALFYFEEAYRADPGRYDLGVRLARIALVMGEVEHARALLDSVEGRAPEHAGLHSARAELALHDGNVQAALRAAQKAVELDPDDSETWFQLGRSHQARIRRAQLARRRAPHQVLKAALTAFARADEIGAGSPRARLERARTLAIRKSAWNEAEAAYRDTVTRAESQGEGIAVATAADATIDFARKASREELERWALEYLVRAQPDRLDAWERLARLAGEPAAGEAVLSRLLALQPESSSAHQLFVSHLARNEEYARAAAHLQQQLATARFTPRLWEQLLSFQLRLRQNANARATYVRMAEEYPEDPLTRRAGGRLALAEGRPGDAETLLHALIPEFTNAETLRLLATAEYRGAKLEQASATIERSVGLAAGFTARALRLKARIHYDAGEWELALRALGELEKSGRTLGVEEQLLKARTLYERGEGPVGAALLEALLASPDPPGAAAVEFARREGTARPELARAHLDAALERTPDGISVLRARTELDLGAGRIAQALARIDPLAEAEGVSPALLLLRARIRFDAGQLVGAEADAMRAFEAAPTIPGATDLLISIYTQQNRLEEAQHSFEAADQAGLLRPAARLLLGRIHLARGDPTRARSALERVVREAPELPHARLELAKLLAKRGEELDRALELAKGAQLGRGHGEDTAAALGYIYYRKGFNEAALQQFDRAIRLSQRSGRSVSPTLHYQMGLTLKALGRAEQALSAFEKALASGAPFAEAEDARKELETRRSDGPATDTRAASGGRSLTMARGEGR